MRQEIMTYGAWQLGCDRADCGTQRTIKHISACVTDGSISSDNSYGPHLAVIDLQGQDNEATVTDIAFLYLGG